MDNACSSPDRFAMFGVLSLVGRAARHGPVQSSLGPGRFRQSTTLRVGVGGLLSTAPQSGAAQVVANLSLEGLVNFNEDGRPRPWLGRELDRPRPTACP